MSDTAYSSGQEGRADRIAAVALETGPGRRQPPRLTAKGWGEVAERVIREAARAGVPIREDRELVSLLMRMDLDETIPLEAYEAVAEILVFLYGLNETWRAERGYRPLSAEPARDP